MKTGSKDNVLAIEEGKRRTQSPYLIRLLRSCPIEEKVCAI